MVDDTAVLQRDPPGGRETPAPGCYDWRSLISSILRTIDEHGLVERGQLVLVGLSGGPDSTALLHGLLAVRERLGIRLCAAVVDHGLRPESAGEAALVAERCRAAGVACTVLTVDVRAARTAHVSWQDAARRARLGALEEAARAQRADAVALGHTADDQAETVLFRIVRGTGLRGLSGIPHRRGVFIRPLLDVRRSEVLHHLRRREIPFVSDPSNDDRRFTRVRVRHEWLPFLARENPRLIDGLLALAAEARGAGPPLPGVARRAAVTVARLAAAGAGTHTVSVAGGDVEVSYGRVRFVARAVRSASAPLVIPVDGPGTYRLARGPALEVTAGTAGSAPASPEAAFDLDQVSLPLSLRSLVAGDRMRPRGGRGSRKLSDLLIDAKVPRPRRAELPVLTAADGVILFVPGLRPAQAGRPGPETRRWIQVRAL
jgi:tRNA(Ile)-lysidine synthase